MKKKRVKIIVIILSSLILICIGVLGFALYGKKQMEKIPTLTIEECLKYTLEGKEKGLITVGLYENGQAKYYLYGENGKELPYISHIYEIGSLTKTFSSALISKAELEGKIVLNDTVDKYLSLNTNKTDKEYPRIIDLITHTSGLKGYYFESEMIMNFLKGRNDFYGISSDKILNRLAKVKLDTSKEYSFKYSNFGFAIIGQVLESIYQDKYTNIVNNYTKDLGLNNTKIITTYDNKDLDNYWEWDTDDGYMAAGALCSNAEDMLKYGVMQLEDNEIFTNTHKKQKDITKTDEKNDMMNINMNAIGLGWIIDEKNNLIWHNGGTDNYNSYLGINKESKRVVIVLSNLSPDFRIPATVIGVKYLINK